MAHRQQRTWFSKIKTAHPEWFDGVQVLEVGSLNINGTVRDFYNATRYVGVDIGPGPGVDVVSGGEKLDYPDNSFDIAVSAECFEHNPEWVATFTNMHRMANTAVLITCASDGRPEHGTSRTDRGSSPHTGDYYRNLNQQDFEQHFDLQAMFSEHAFEYNPESQDLYFYGVKA
jgi:ubiquinone/menaquinone biosynthesis C-methylase UbiE